MKIVFFGTPDFAAYCLDTIIESEVCTVASVVTMPDKIAGRGHHLIQSPVKATALTHGLPILQPTSLKDPAFIAELTAVEADLFVVIAFRMLPEIVWAMPPKGTFNLHASLLPAYRGAAPINWTLINGESKTGVTTFFLKHEIDTGDIIDQQEVDILPDDNAGTLHDRLMKIGACLTVKTIKEISTKGRVTSHPQNEIAGKSASAPKIFTTTCHIDWNRPAIDIHNLVRGLSPYPAAWSDSSLGPIKIFETSLTGIPSPEVPGTVVIDKKNLFLSTATTLLRIESLQAPGKKRMPASQFLNGLKSPLTFIS